MGVKLDNGRMHNYAPLIVAQADAARSAWHVVKGGKIVAGGLGISEARATEIAAELGGSVRKGLRWQISAAKAAGP